MSSMNNPEETRMLLNTEQEALAARTLLEELRAGRSANAMELLEQRIDVSVCAMDRLARTAQPQDRERLSGVLKVLSEYRRRYPRESEAASVGGFGVLVARSRAEADRILKNVTP